MTTSLPHPHFLTTQEDIKAWLNDYGVKEYTLLECEQYGYVVNADSVDLKNKQLQCLRVKFNEVYGDFYCQANKLTSLWGSPEKVFGNCWLNSNYLENLQWGPNFVKGNDHLSHNNIQHFYWLPQEVGGKIFLSGNKELKNFQEYTHLESIKKHAKVWQEKNFLAQNITNGSTQLSHLSSNSKTPFKL